MSLSLPTSPSWDQIVLSEQKPELSATLWEDEGCICFQVKVKGVCIARRDGADPASIFKHNPNPSNRFLDNHMINGTKLFNFTSYNRGRRDAILKLEHVKHVVRTGPQHLMGVWIPFERALVFANKENITEALFPLFVPNLGPLLHHSINQRVRDFYTVSSSSSNVAGTLNLRSRSGCYTCRLRRKKCFRGQDRCIACWKFDLQCEYERPQWWKDDIKRKTQKEHINKVIKKKRIKWIERETLDLKGNLYLCSLSLEHTSSQQSTHIPTPTSSHVSSSHHQSPSGSWKDSGTDNSSPITVSTRPCTEEEGWEMELQLLQDPHLPLLDEAFGQTDLFEGDNCL